MGEPAPSSDPVDDVSATTEVAPVTAEQMSLAEKYLDAIARREMAEADIALFKAELIDATAKGVVIPTRGFWVVRSERKPNAQLNVVRLLKSGTPREAFLEPKPSVTKFRAYAEENRWTDAQRDKFILDGGPAVPTVTVRTKPPHEDDEEN